MGAGLCTLVVGLIFCNIFVLRSPSERVCCRFSGITATAYSLRVLTLHPQGVRRWVPRCFAATQLLPRWERGLVSLLPERQASSAQTPSPPGGGQGARVMTILLTRGVIPMMPVRLP